MKLKEQNKDFPVNQTRYRIDGVLGAGGQGRVYQGYDLKLARNVAIKLVPMSGAHSLREAQTLAKLDSTRIVRVFDVFNNEDYIAIVMELVAACIPMSPHTLHTMSSDTFFNFFKQLLDAVEVIHSANILHLDLKPGNILYNESGKVKVTDFGISRDNNEKISDKFNDMSTDKGSWYCLSPEQLEQKKPSKASDIFALGILLFAFLYKKHPFIVDGDISSSQRNILNGKPQIAECILPAVDPQLVALSISMLDKNPKNRPSLEVIKQIIYRVSSESLSLATETIPIPKIKNHPHRLWVACACSIIVLLIATTLFISSSPSVSQTLVVPPLYSHSSIEGQSHYLHEKNVLIASIIEDELQEGVIIDPSRRLLSKKMWGGTQEWQKEAKQAQADEILFSEVNCGESLCDISLTLFDAQSNKTRYFANQSIPHEDLILVSQLIAHMIQTELKISAANGLHTPLSAEEFRQYLLYKRKLDSLDISLEDIEPLITIANANPNFLAIQTLLGHYYLGLYKLKTNPEWLTKTKYLLHKLEKQSSQSANFYILQFYYQLNTEQFLKSEETLQRIFSTASVDINQLFLAKTALHFKQKPTEAYQNFLNFKGLHINNDYFRYKAHMEHHLKLFEALEETSTTWKNRYPNTELATLHLKASYINLGKLTQALNLYQIGADDNIHDANNAGICQLLLGNYNASIATFTKALDFNPDNIDALLNLGEALKIKGDLNQSQHYFKKALTLLDKKTSLNTYDYAQRALLLAHLDQDEDALIALQNASQNITNDAFYLMAAHAYSLLEKPQTALYNAKEGFKRGYRAHWYRYPWTQNLYEQLTASTAQH
ncbi:protein kinase domain-containing protein [Marinibactrum halimedae]|uniref:Protein kinase domain-containing protein n=1 Tax=Marinibactrum halimedae TaxID=1444977 RepID=A0AA37T1B7_9GAMM|nr:serine/threonine-protein kinase [Marinibactrum halimedae]MCD9458189.1 protein kinase [Marinibactrum halimedae]GLS25124.1 hypothetical protein GCM10007877_08380 [Marinibactrum halimedae]